MICAFILDWYHWNGKLICQNWEKLSYIWIWTYFAPKLDTADVFATLANQPTTTCGLYLSFLMKHFPYLYALSQPPFLSVSISILSFVSLPLLYLVFNMSLVYTLAISCIRTGCSKNVFTCAKIFSGSVELETNISEIFSCFISRADVVNDHTLIIYISQIDARGGWDPWNIGL